MSGLLEGSQDISTVVGVDSNSYFVHTHHAKQIRCSQELFSFCFFHWPKRECPTNKESLALASVTQKKDPFGALKCHLVGVKCVWHLNVYMIPRPQLIGFRQASIRPWVFGLVHTVGNIEISKVLVRSDWGENLLWMLEIEKLAAKNTTSDQFLGTHSDWNMPWQLLRVEKLWLGSSKI